MTEKKYTTTTTVTEETQTQVQLDTYDGLTPSEEKVLRMLHGLTEDEAPLQFALGANEETRAQLALMENQLLDLFGRKEHLEPEHMDAKARIIDALKG